MKTIRILIATAVALAGGLIHPNTAQSAPGKGTIGFETGLPLVAGLEASWRVDPHWRLGVQYGQVSGMSALGAEARWLIMEEQQGFVPSLWAGANQFFLEDGGRDATPVGIRAGVALDYHLNAPVSFGAELGAMRTFGSSSTEDVRVFSIQANESIATFNVGARWHF